MMKPIGIQVNNEFEFNILKLFYTTVKDWEFGRYSYEHYKNECDKWHNPLTVAFRPKFSFNLTEDWMIIPFEHFAALNGLAYKPVVIKMVNQFTATIYPDKAEIFSVRNTGCTLTKKEVEDLYAAIKSFELA